MTSSECLFSPLRSGAAGIAPPAHDDLESSGTRRGSRESHDPVQAESSSPAISRIHLLWIGTETLKTS